LADILENKKVNNINPIITPSPTKKLIPIYQYNKKSPTNI
jgi:hypothetical protein